MWKVKPPVYFPMETRYRTILESLVPPDPMSQFPLRRGSPDEEFPDLSRNHTWMGRILTAAMYRRQFHRCTHSGVLFDDVIRPGLEEPGDWCSPASVGCVAGDAESYILFCDFFDRVIEAHHRHKITSQTPESDFNCDNLKGGEDLDRSYAVRCEVSVVRGVEGFCFPTHCSRGERRELLTLARRALQRLEEDLPGRLLLLEDLTQDQQRELDFDPPSDSQLRIGVARDWPDARGVWVSKDGSLVVWVNMEDHLRLVSTRDDANITEAFKCMCINLQKLEDLCRELKHPFTWKQQLGWVSSSPADVGTGLRIRVNLKLQHLPKHNRLQDVLKRLRLCMDTTDSPALYCVSNTATFGLSEVGLTQLVVDGVKLLIAMEKRLEVNGDIEGLIPAQK
ncbi:creatine kinase B-type [Pseudochaenichthys georgianus]|uniref:creatine kinase B-type n=1 Tax=Pseudochaenichthys georgianus TaxID=52239 RepID=UPI00146B5BFB|nr:creatine kinase B-type isoform X1 [Pseudochaenichthys georgianus]